MIVRPLQHSVIGGIALMLGVTAFVVIVFWTSFGSMWALWQTTDHRLGILVFPISAFLVWRLRNRIADLPLRMDVRGMILVAVLTVVWIVARIGGLQVVEHFAVLALIPAGVFALAGPQLTRAVLFPLLFLLVATPLGDSLVPYLMAVTADIATALLKLSGIPVLRDGQYLSLPGGDFVVAEVCGGLRYVATGFMISLLFGYISYTSPVKRLVLTVTTILIMVVTNGVRVFVITSVASATHMRYLGGRDHIVFGWILFGLVTMLIMSIAVRYTDDRSKPGNAKSATAAVSNLSPLSVPFILALGLIMLAVTIKPVQTELGRVATIVSAGAVLFLFVVLIGRRPARRERTGSSLRDSPQGEVGAKRLALAATTLLLMIAASRYVDWIEESPVPAMLDNPFSETVPCEFAGAWANRWRPDFGTPDAEYAAQYRCEGGMVNVYSAGYATTMQNDELISSLHRPIPSDLNHKESMELYSLPGYTGQQVKIVEAFVEAEGSGNLVWYWYDVDGRVVTMPLRVKFLQILSALKGRPAGGRVFVIETDLHGDATAARTRLRQVAEAVIAHSTKVSRGNVS